ncbi:MULTISPECIES: aryl-sulfate sulfotransferase [unclassified Pseudomonas]|uniref:aryl-sulfate sulfotransferase n=1 Tax=unclassified Pseudomonas TaxID=196821 RepID=UPI00129E35FC|nr:MULTISPECIES: aryl-sulfate sulfotransferase [unclassified Pseudomonas]MDH4656603.1 aryl sulfotransferase [Pseudomonas sp. BN606]MRK23477.1 aryl sulfotransferase [Pseudomonas sp. JG-B]
MNAKTETPAIPEGACITAKVPERGTALLGDVVVNPYKLAPLIAIIRDGGQAISAAHVRVLGRGERGVDIAYEVSERSLWTYGGIPVFGLYPDHVNQVEVTYKLDGERIRERYQVYAPAVRLPVVANQTAALPLVEPIKVAPGFEHRLYLFNHLLGEIPGGRAFKWNALGGAAEWDQVGNNWIADSNGDVRWYLDIEQIHDSGRRDGLGGTMGFQQTRDGKLIWGQGQTYSKYDLLGRRVWQRALPDKFADFSHEIRETPNGTYLLRVGTSDYRRPDNKRVRSIRDHIIEVNEAGDVLDFWDLNQILDPYRGELLETLGKAAIQLPEGVQKQESNAANELLEGDLPFGDTPGVGTGRNWAHVNAIDYDASDDSIIISARHQGVVKIGRNKEVKWILASPQGWPERLKAKVLTPVNAKGEALAEEGGLYAEGFDWSWTQHTAWLTGKGTLSVFDNGWGRNFSPTKLAGNYSRAVEYRIDEAKGTVEQLWEYGKERGDEWYSPVTSVVEYRADKDTQFIYSASVGFLTPEKLTTTVLNEVKYGTQDVQVELKVSSRQPGSVGYRALVIDLACAFS